MQTESRLLAKWKWMILGVGAVLLYVLLLLGHHRLPDLLAGQDASRKPSVPQLVGIEAIERELGRNAPVGRGVPMGHVEGKTGDYLPDLKQPRFRGVGMTPQSGASKVNRHAQATAKKIYGRHGLAPGVNDVHFYTTTHWLGKGIIKTASDLPPDSGGRRVFTHSWIGHGSSGAANTLRRIDYLIDEQDVIMAVGVNNRFKSKVPALLASAYNVIAVGVTSGNSSGKYTRFEGAGRCKPDIVAPQKLTSFSTPVVASIAARLLETADRMEHVPAADRSEVIKAVLMAGAEKPEGWQPQPGKPLDEHLGAGSVRFDNSYRILTTGPIGPGRVSNRYGWDFQSITNDEEASYGFDTVDPYRDVSVMLVWNRRIDGRQVTDLFTRKTRWLDQPRLADFDLRLLRLNDQGNMETVEASASRVDNVEHIYLKHLPPGRYVIEVNRHDTLSEKWDYSIAWRFEESASPEETLGG